MDYLSHKSRAWERHRQYMDSTPFEKIEYALEYSAVCDEDGMFPFHYLPITNPDLGRPPYHWKIIARGTYEQIIAIMEEWEQKKLSQEHKKRERGKMTKSLRYDIMQRDGFKCRTCGRDSSDGVKLVVDHIVPVSKGGKTIMDNLQMLCRECNIGKGTK